ncbi:MAG: alpha/beta hydrolase [Planctomycetota bacterium]
MLRYALLTVSFVVVTGVTSVWAAGPEPIPLWPEKVPGATGEDEPDRPSVRIHQPAKGKANGAAVVICPGGGYGIIAMDHEGSQVANWFTSQGVTALVLRYRLGPKYRHPLPLNDAQRAIRYARANAEKLGISAHRIGVMGFSAGGHLASTAATHFDAGQADAADPVDRVSCRPDFVILGYPVISLTAEFAHKGSARNLLGETPDQQLLDNLSNEKQVTKDTPPAFLFHTGDDTGVPAENSLAFFSALRKVKVPAELHIYQQGPHGVGLAPGDPALHTWKERLFDWLRQNRFLAEGETEAVQGKITLNGQPLKWGQLTLISRDSKYKPVGFAMIHNGNYSIAKDHGILPGEYTVVVVNQGDITHQQTLDDVQQVLHEKGGVVVKVVPGDKNIFALDLKN